MASPAKKAVKSAKQETVRAVLHTTALDCSIGYSLRRAQLSTYPAFASLIDKFDIRPSQYAVLVLIRENPGLSQSAVSLTLGIQKANFVAVMDRLEERGLTERRKVGGDRRSSALFLTRTGETFIRKLENRHAQLEQDLASRLGVRRSRQFLQMLHEFASKATD
jgi:DNA-binding MarR family transcriptional regulator